MDFYDFIEDCCIENVVINGGKEYFLKKEPFYEIYMWKNSKVIDSNLDNREIDNKLLNIYTEDENGANNNINNKHSNNKKKNIFDYLSSDECPLTNTNDKNWLICYFNERNRDGLCLYNCKERKEILRYDYTNLDKVFLFEKEIGDEEQEENGLYKQLEDLIEKSNIIALYLG